MPKAINGKRVVITGVGLVSPLGCDPVTAAANLGRGDHAVTSHPFTGHSAFAHCTCGRVTDKTWVSTIPGRKLVKLMNREAMMAAAAAAAAVCDAVPKEAYPPERIGLYMGTGLTSGELEELLPVLERSFDEAGQFSSRRLGEAGLEACNPLVSFKILTNMALSFISMLFDIRGDNLAFHPWPGNTAQAIIAGARAVAWEEVDCALVGGCDSKTHAIGFLFLEQMGLLSRSGIPRPLPEAGDGIIPGEGAAVLVLEEMQSARRRGVPIYAEIAGWAEETDLVSSTLYPQDAAVLKRTMEHALASAGMTASEVDAVHASFGGHPPGDRCEADALAELFGPTPLTISLTSRCGNLLAAAPAVSLALAAQFLRSGRARALLVNALDLGCVKSSLVARRVA